MAWAVSNNLDLKLSLAQSITQKRIDQANERLSTGKRINSAKDDDGRSFHLIASIEQQKMLKIY